MDVGTYTMVCSISEVCLGMLGRLSLGSLLWWGWLWMLGALIRCFMYVGCV